MRILWNYLRPHHRLALLALLLAATSQVLALIDPIIFGRIVDGYALPVAGRSDDERMSGVLHLSRWLSSSRCCRGPRRRCRTT